MESSKIREFHLDAMKGLASAAGISNDSEREAALRTAIATEISAIEAARECNGISEFEMGVLLKSASIISTELGEFRNAAELADRALVLLDGDEEEQSRELLFHAVAMLIGREDFDPADGHFWRHLREPDEVANESKWKKILDVVLALFLTIFLMPLLLIIALSVKLTSRGPLLFYQVRSGLHGRPFRLYKFRTMRVGADLLQAQVSTANVMDGPIFKLKTDPRITVVGRLLRRLSLDELPQLWNILNGDMSFVGPRPPLPAEVGNYDPWHLRRLSVRPGLTCTWQTLDRRTVDFDTWMSMDLEYVRTWSPMRDLALIWNYFLSFARPSSQPTLLDRRHTEALGGGRAG